MTKQLNYALAYARKGLNVFPCRGKIPLTEHGFKDATRDEIKIKNWWHENPEANIGIACGKESGITVLDIDPRNGGDSHNGKVSNLPKTPKVYTGGGGCHLYFKYNGSGSGVLDRGLDLQSDGKYVIAPPSIHPDTNKPYEWDKKLMFGATPLAEAPQLKIEKKILASDPDADIPEGQRDNTLFSLGGAMRRRGASQEAIEVALLEENRKRCKPPLSDWEVKRLAKSASRYEPAESLVVTTVTSNGSLQDKERPKFNSLKVAESVAGNNIIFSGGEFYRYENGCYRPINRRIVNQYIKKIIGESLTKKQSEEILYFLESDVYVEEDKLNNIKYINLKNGLFDIETKILIPHSPDVFSTIQLNVRYDLQANCSLWFRTLEEIFEGDTFKMETLQEFFGLCLTKETKHNKALMCIGEGNNGKSVVLKTLEALLGRDNFSSIPLERFDNSNYMANLFGKLANISIETHAKGTVYDSNFKAITSGDSIEAEKKFRQPFSFRPFCKLVFAMNNLPRVDDKTNAFFNRLLIIRFQREFSENEQNKTLYLELVKELDGIFLWALEGLKNLEKRGYFERNEEMEALIRDYRRENNNVLVFVDEECALDPDNEVEKDVLYNAYKNFCQDNGYRSLSKKKFGMELSKHYKAVLGGYNPAGSKRTWQGIATNYRHI
jgi:putative DNA primase/helicase